MFFFFIVFYSNNNLKYFLFLKNFYVLHFLFFIDIDILVNQSVSSTVQQLCNYAEKNISNISEVQRFL